MSNAWIAGGLWVLLATVVAFLPMRRQYAPGVMLLLAAPPLVCWIGASHGWLPGLLALCAFLSMFRNPLRFFWARACGSRLEVPK